MEGLYVSYVLKNEFCEGEFRNHDLFNGKEIDSQGQIVVIYIKGKKYIINIAFRRRNQWFIKNVQIAKVNGTE